MSKVTIIGGGLAGSEAAWQAASAGVQVVLHEMRPARPTAVHKTDKLAELVCSNSFRGDKLDNAVGLLKEEMRRLGSLIMRAADQARVPAGAALAVDRERFSQLVTDAIASHPSIEVRREEVPRIPASLDGPLIIATGPLTSESLSADIAAMVGGDHLYFYDAISPIVLAESIDSSKVFRASRWGRSLRGAGDFRLKAEATNGPSPTGGFHRQVEGPVKAEATNGPSPTGGFHRQVEEPVKAEATNGPSPTGGFHRQVEGPVKAEAANGPSRTGGFHRQVEGPVKAEATNGPSPTGGFHLQVEGPACGVDDGEGDYLNCPFTADEYARFYEALMAAEKAPLHEFDDPRFFEGCLPIEVMAARGVDTLRFGPMKPVGLPDPRTGRDAYAIVQLRQDNLAGDHFSLVGFQTQMKWGEQARVLRMIPGLEQAEFVRFGMIHRNTYINGPTVLRATWQTRTRDDIFFAGQISGVEGYVESAASGLIAGRNAAAVAAGREPSAPPRDTAIGALGFYVANANPRHYQPSNITFGIMPPPSSSGGRVPKKKADRKALYAERALAALDEWNRVPSAAGAAAAAAE